MSLIVTSDLIELTKIGLNEVYLNEIAAPDPIYEKIFDVQDSDKALEEELVMAGFGNIPEWNADGGKITYDKPISGDRIAFTHTDFALAWKVSHKMLREDLYDKTSRDLVKAAGISTRHSIEQDAANVFNLGFTVNGPGGVPLFSANHPLLGGGTQSNITTSAALTEESYKIMSILIAKSVNERGQLLNYKPEIILVPPDLKYIAQSIFGSHFSTSPVKGSGGAAVGPSTIDNPVRGELEVVVWPYLTSTTAWFVLASKNQRYLKFFWRERPWYDAWIDPETKGVGNSVAYAYSVGYSRYNGVWGNQGA